MSLRRKIFIAFVLILGLAGAGMTSWVQREARDSYAHVIEEILADLAQLFATQIQTEIASRKVELANVANWEKSFDDFKARRFTAEILHLVKTRSAIDVYVTDSKGIVLYSSRDRNEVGQDYSQWRDVALTLKGKYGARATRLDRNEKKTSIYYVAAPIFSGEKIVGVVSAIKARASVTTVLDYFFNKMILGVAFVILLALIFGALLFIWITSPIEKLRSYALAVSAGQKPALPPMPHRELRELENAFEEMRVSLEGRKTIERFIQSLIHELKSPLAAVRGSAELMLEPMTEDHRSKFLRNILEEGARAEKVLQEILSIASLESQTSLAKIENVDVAQILDEAQDALVAICSKNQVSFSKSYKDVPVIQGDRFLLTQAFRNVLQNAVEFSEPGSTVFVNAWSDDSQIKVNVIDCGSGIPSYAQDKIFEKFFSLERPRTGKKGTGLGLSFVREVVLLHRGEISIRSQFQNERGTSVEIQLPMRL